MSQEDNFRERLDAVVRARIPGCAGLVAADRLSGGASQETWRLLVKTASGERRLAMRRAAGGEYVEVTPQRPGLDVEALLMQCARQAGVPEPEVLHVLTRQDDLGDGFIMEWLEGEALGARIVRSPEFEDIRPGLARECGCLLARIHAIDLDRTGLRDRLWEVSTPEFVEQTWERYRLLETPQPMIDYAARWLLEHLPEDDTRALVHNDFRNGNFMLSPKGIVAVLDWEMAHIGDPVRDLGWICTSSWRFGAEAPVGGFGDYEDLFRGYEEVSGRAVDPEHVRFWEVFGSFWWSVACLGMAEHYRSGPDKTVERPTIGRRSSEGQADCVNLLIPGQVALVSPGPAFSSLDMPRTDELLTSVRDFLRDDVMAATEGRANFLSRVAANSLDILLRELSLGPGHQAAELDRLRALFQSGEDLTTLRRRLVRQLRDEQISLDDPALQNHLRQTVLNQLAIDQPGYAGFRKAMSYGQAGG